MSNSSGATNREVLLEAWEAMNSGEGPTKAIEEHFSEEYVRHAEEGDYSRAEYAEIIEALQSGFPDLDYNLSQILADGDLVAYRWTSTGTHEGLYMGVPPTHRRVTAHGLTISRFEGGRIVEEWASWNKVAVLHRLGIIPIDVA